METHFYTPDSFFLSKSLFMIIRNSSSFKLLRKKKLRIKKVRAIEVCLPLIRKESQQGKNLIYSGRHQFRILFLF
ncbi:hypothetical protein Hanom_Chr14g01324311 [Helianthus anomalus]